MNAIEVLKATLPGFGVILNARGTIQAVELGQSLPEFPRHIQCRHRSVRGHCGERSWTCAYNHGQGGIVEPETDCVGCEDAEG